MILYSCFGSIWKKKDKYPSSNHCAKSSQLSSRLKKEEEKGVDIKFPYIILLYVLLKGTTESLCAIFVTFSSASSKKLIWKARESDVKKGYFFNFRFKVACTYYFGAKTATIPRALMEAAFKNFWQMELAAKKLKVLRRSLHHISFHNWISAKKRATKLLYFFEMEYR